MEQSQSQQHQQSVMIGQKEACLERVVPLIQNSLDSADEHHVPEAKHMCNAFEELMSVMELEDEVTLALDVRLCKYARYSGSGLQEDLATYVTLQGDLLSAATILSNWIIENYNATERTSNVDSDPYLRLHKQNNAKLQLLLSLLAERYAAIEGSTAKAEPPPLPTKYEVLSTILQRQQWRQEASQQANEMLSFDKKDLQMEENELLNMAYTPIPSETAHGTIALPKTTVQPPVQLEGTIHGDDDEQSWKIYMTPEGVLQIQPMAPTSAQHALGSTCLITAATVASFQSTSNMLIMTNVLAVSSFKVTDLSVTIPEKQASDWQNSIQRMASKLCQSKTQQTQLQALWTPKQYNQRLMQARLYGAMK